MQVGQILQEKGRDVATVPATAALAEVARVLAARRIGAVVVLNAQGGIAGILSERDLVRAMAENGPEALTRPASAYMTGKVVTARPNNSVEEMMGVMTAGHFRHVPVLDDAGKICGIISIGDVVKAHIAEAAREASHLRQYITESR